MLGGVVITELCDHVGVRGAGIKWPNDVQVNGLKVSGVLPEAVWGGNRLLGVALGMGINVRIDFRGTELEDSAISLETALGKSLDRLDLLLYLLERIDHWAARMETGPLFDVWKQRLNMIGKRVTVTDDSGVVQGIAETVEVQGTLLIRAEDGSLHRVLAGDVMMGTGE
jgi:BirA family biotin operon repressor/biotin-[acetyl-CoA-carboxylase] ligase